MEDKKIIKKLAAKLHPFTGKEDLEEWLQKFEWVMVYSKWKDEEAAIQFSLLMEGKAYDWIMSLSDETRKSLVTTNCLT